MGQGTADHAIGARCTRCGGAVPLVLTGPLIACGYCGEPDPLEPALAERVAALRARLGGTVAQQRQLVVRQKLAAESFDSPITQLSSLAMWALFGLLPAIFIGTRPDGMGMGEFLAGTSPQIRGDELVTKWWLFWSCATGPTAIYALQKIFGTVAAVRLVRVVLPQPPSAPGAPPRCRCCSAELPGGGRVRRCDYCASDHLVDGNRYRQVDDTVAGQLDAMDREITLRTEGTGSAGSNLLLVMVTVGFFGPWVSAMVGAYAVGEPRPGAWYITAGVVGAAVLAKLISLRVRFPDVPTLYGIQAGESIEVRGQRRQVVARLSIGSTIADGVKMLFLVGDDGHATHAVIAGYDLNDHRVVGNEYQLEVGGRPLATDDEDHQRLGPVDIQSAVDPRFAGISKSWALCKQPGTTFRMWLQPPAAGESPAFTLRPGASLGDADLFLPGRDL